MLVRSPFRQIAALILMVAAIQYVIAVTRSLQNRPSTRTAE